MKNLFKRDDTYYMRISVQGKRVWRSLGTGAKREAEARCRKLRRQVKAEHYEVLEQIRVVRGFATIQQICDAYEKAALTRGLRPKTIRSCANSLKLIVKGTGAQNAGKRSSTCLTGDLVTRYAAKMIRERGDNDRTRRSIRSTLRQARAVFARWAIPEYKGLKLPDLAGFMQIEGVRNVPISYHLPPQELIDATLKAARDLEGDLRLAYLLCYHLGLRAGEAASVRWDWFREINGRLVLEVINRSGFKPKGRGRSMPVHSDVWIGLQEERVSGVDTVLPRDTYNARLSLISRELAAWMRGLGWDAATYPKAAHELRKLIGSRWYTELSAEVAQKWLGHASVATTCTYYADLTTQPAPLAMS